MRLNFKVLICMNKKLMIKILIGLGLLVIVLMAIGEYQWRTMGLGVVIDRKKALGVVTNQYGIRDQDLEIIKKSNFDEKNKKLLMQVAKDYQDQITHSNDREWIKANGRKVYVRGFCIISYENKFFKKNIADASILDFFMDNDERKYLINEYEANYYDLEIPTKSMSEEEKKSCYE